MSLQLAAEDHSIGEFLSTNVEMIPMGMGWVIILMSYITLVDSDRGRILLIQSKSFQRQDLTLVSKKVLLIYRKTGIRSRGLYSF